MKRTTNNPKPRAGARCPLCDTIRAAINERDALFASAIANTTGDQGPRT